MIGVQPCALPISADREPVEIPERGVNVLIQGDPLSGKSWLAGVLIERLLGRRYAVCVVDPEGDYQVLAPVPGVSWFETRSLQTWDHALERFDHDPAACVVLDLSTLEQERKAALIAAGFGLIRERRRRAGPPHWLVLDEAHYWLGEGGGGGRGAGGGRGEKSGGGASFKKKKNKN